VFRERTGELPPATFDQTANPVKRVPATPFVNQPDSSDKVVQEIAVALRGLTLNNRRLWRSGFHFLTDQFGMITVSMT